VPVRTEVVSLEGMSAHADAAQLVQWLSTAPWPPQRVFVTHGEPAAADALRQRIGRELGWSASVPLLGRSVELGA
jgi:metallo-beta-lactamase family protein